MRALALSFVCLVCAVQGRRVQPSVQEESATSKALATLLLANNPVAGYQTIGATSRCSPDVNIQSRSSPPTLMAKDPNAPKRPASAYFLYTADRRPALKAEGLSVAEIGKKTGEEWGVLSDKEKKPYQDKVDKAKAEYEIALSKYKESDEYAAFQESSAGAGKTIKVKKGTKDKELKKMLKNQPKKAKNAFMLFADQKRPEVAASKPGAKVGEIAKIIGEMWASASEDVKAPLQKQYEQNKVDYEEKMKAYMESDEYKAYLEATATAA